jgi:very-short-patch-repair endonuclease
VKALDAAVLDLAKDQQFLISRPQLEALGASSSAIDARLRSGSWIRRQCGVVQIDNRPQDWHSLLMTAVLAAGDGARASHRSAFVLWGLEGISTRFVELTVPYTHGPVPTEVIVHRTRRPHDGTQVDGIPVTAAERTLLDCAAQLPAHIIGKALDSAIRRDLVTMDSVNDVLVTAGGRGVRGTRRLRSVLSERHHDTATDSGSEYELLRHMQAALLPPPELHHELWPENGRRVPDFFWPDRNKAVEVDGLDAHSSADKLDDDLKRQNDLMDLGIEIRRFSAREIRRNPLGVVSQIRRFLDE